LDPDGGTKSRNKAGPSGKGSSIACNAVRYASAKRRVEKLNERYGLWLLKNSLTGKWSKKLCNRKPYKRRSPFW
jgi:hypothetical protein